MTERTILYCQACGEEAAPGHRCPERCPCCELRGGFHLGTCSLQKDREIAKLREEKDKTEKERDLALANADFWERELNNFRRNAAHRAEQLAKEKIETSERQLSEAQEALRKIAEECKDRIDGANRISRTRHVSDFVDWDSGGTEWHVRNAGMTLTFAA